MPAKPSTGKCDKHNSMVNRHIGTAYDTVKIVADNIETIEEIGDNLPYLLKYLGAYSTPPTERPDGSPLQDGDYYFDSVSEALVYYKLSADKWFEVDPQEILNARDEAIAARDAAQLAQANAETAEANAEVSELVAAQSENNAATSASEAATSESNAATSESNAAGSAADALASENAAYASELAAAQSEGNASTSELNANLSAQAAAQSEANALSSEINAASSATIASQAAADAEQAFDNFTDLYLGAHEVDPTEDNDGNPLQVGATYWNIPNTTLLYWSGYVWDSPEETAIQAANTAIAARDDAQISETNAEGFADDAEVSATNAATSEGNAANSASTAQSAATTAGNHATTATNAASAASQSETNAAASELNALASENKAELWAEEDEDVEVEPNRYSAKHWASKAEQEAGVLTWQKHARTGTDLNQMREQNKDVRAASGFDHYGKVNSYANPDVINEGLYTYGNEVDTLFMGRQALNGVGSSETNFPINHIAGFISEIYGVGGTTTNFLKFPEAPNGTVTFDTTTGVTVQHPDAATAFAAETATNKVVIDRYDLFGGEFFLEEVTGSNPYVYPKGMIQSQATEMNGITTVSTNRPDTYYAVFIGDTDSNGLGVDFWAATDVEKIGMVSDESNNLFLLEDGRLVQWRMRQRTIAGAKNGDWNNIDPTASAATIVCGESATGTWLAPQGNQDTAKAYSGGNVDVGTFQSSVSSVANEVNFTDNGTFKAYQNGYHPFAVDGECYFHVWGVVRRLNQGAYHPSFNALGTCKATDGFWHESSLLVNSASCFTNADTLTGDISSTISGRSDGRYYDAIYSGGDGGVNDHRLPSWDMSSKEEASKVFQKVVNGTYRGEERLVNTRVGNPVTTDTVSSSFMAIGTVGIDDWMIGLEVQSVSTVSGSTVLDTVTVFTQGTIYESSGLYWVESSVNTSRTNGQQAVVTWYGDSTVSGEFSMVDVIGDPSRIINTPDLANGWQGGWVTELPDGTSKQFRYSRKNINTDPTQPILFTPNDGASWASSTAAYSNVTNSISLSSGSTTVLVCDYRAFAKQTAKADNVNILNAMAGVGEVWAGSGWYDPNEGGLITETLMSKVATNNVAPPVWERLVPFRVPLSAESGVLFTNNADYTVTHDPLTLGGRVSTSPAVKVLWHQTANAQEVSLNFVWNELIYNPGGIVGNEWGDTIAATTYANAKGTFSITDGTGTYTNLNGDTALRGTATLSKPIGYSKNHARVGTQTKGVDV